MKKTHAVFLAALAICVFCSLIVLGWQREQGGAELYFLPVGDNVSVEMLQVLSEMFEERCNLHPVILPVSDLPESAFDFSRIGILQNEGRVTAVSGQINSDKVLRAMAAAWKVLGVKSVDSTVIAFTEYDVFIPTKPWAFSFAARWLGKPEAARPSVGLISTARMYVSGYAGQAAGKPEVLSRLYKMTAKQIGLLYFRMDSNNDPRSVLYGNIMGVAELDGVSDDTSIGCSAQDGI